MKSKHLKALFLILVLFNFSCTQYKSVPYFQDLKSDDVFKEKIENYAPLTIQPGDLLGLHQSSLNHDADAIINYNLERPNGVSNIDRAEENAIVGYLVDDDGSINLPMVGAVKVGGLTTKEAINLLETKLSEFFTKPVIKLRIQNFKISVLGDVKNPGAYGVANERITVPEALGLAGDLNVTGIRKNVLIIREINGEREYVHLNLLSKSLFNSPYYYLKNNDVLYVQPNKDKVASSDSALTKASILISALSLLAIFLTRK